MAEHLASIFGTEKDRVNCPFYFKIGACRHGDRCSRLHNRPTISPTLLLSNMYQRPDSITPGLDPQGQAIDPIKIQEHFEDFYEDIFEELSKFGELETLNICDNLADHMVGNVYVQFKEEDQAAAAVRALQGRFYSGRPIIADFSPVTDFREATCRQFEEDSCNRGGYCNFMHVKQIGRELRKKLFGRYRRFQGRRSRSRSRSRSQSPRHRRDHRDNGYFRGGGGGVQLPPGFRFHPTDEELVMHYLCRKCAGSTLAVPIIAEIDLYKHDPWELPGMALYGEKEWYFFSPRDRKYPNGSRPNRAAGSGYWKATGADKPVGSPKAVAIKKALVFYAGKAPKGDKTNWIMHEYRLADVDRSIRKKNSLRLDDWVLCRIYKKKGGADRPAGADKKPVGSGVIRPDPELKPEMMSHVTHVPTTAPQNNDMFYFDTSDSLPRLHGESSCSEQVPSPEFACEREVQSQLRWGELERALGAPMIDVDASAPFTPFVGGPPLSPLFKDPLQDMFMYLRKPF